MISLTQKDINAIRAHGEAGFPHECCGLLVGQFLAEGGKEVAEIFPISNAREEEAKRNRFLITAEELLRGENYARSRTLDVIGFYHSHPDHPAVPSQFDIDHAWPVYSYIIVSVLKGKSDALTSWELDEDRSHFNPEKIIVSEGD